MKMNQLNTTIKETIASLDDSSLSAERKNILNPLVDYIRRKVQDVGIVRLNFICTHNSRRSHLSQIWAQAMAYYHGLENVTCYSGGTEATAMFPKVAETLAKQGFDIQKLSGGDNPIYGIKYAPEEHAVVCFSKTYDDPFNPSQGFAAIMTCDSANEACPMVIGAESRIAVTYEDPKKFDGTPQQDAKYMERSLQIATELKYVFSEVVSDR